MKKTLYDISVLIGVMILGMACIKTCNHFLKPDTSQMTPEERRITDSIWDAKEAAEFKSFAEDLD